MTPSLHHKSFARPALIGFSIGVLLVGMTIAFFSFDPRHSWTEIFLNPFFYLSLILPLLLAKTFFLEAKNKLPVPGNNSSRPAEKELVEEYFSPWLNSLYDGALILNADFRILTWNKKCELIFRSPGKLRRDDELSSLIPPSTTDKLRELIALENLATTTFELPSGSGAHSNVRLGLTLTRLESAEHPVYLLLIHDLQTSEETLSEIQKAREYAQSIIDCSSEMIISADLDRCITEFNNAAEKCFGYTKAEVLGKPASILYDDIIQSEEINVTLNSRGIVTREVRNRRKNGEKFYCILSASILRDSLGNPTGYMGLSRDISKERESEIILKENEERFRSLCASSPVGIIQTDPGGLCVYCNEQWLELSALTPGQSYAQGWMNAFDAKDHEQLKKCLEQSRHTRQMQHLELQLAHDHKRWAHFRTSVIQLPEGKTIGHVHTVEDITERKWAEAELTKDRRFLKQIVSDAPVAMAMLDGNLSFISTSQKWIQDHPTPSGNLSGISFHTAYPAFSERFKTILGLGLQGEKLSNPEELFVDKNGNKKYLRWAITPISYKGSGIDGVILVTDDVTDIVHAREKAIEAVRIKSQFLANMSHEIRTPMNGVIGVADLLLGTKVNEEQKSLVNIIRSSAETLLKIIDDILDISKIEADKIEIENHPFNIHEAVRQTYELLRARSSSKKIDFNCRISPECPRMVVGDVHRLKQVLMNLTGNALKFTGEGEVTLSLYAFQDYQGMQKLRFTISDTGPGIPLDKMNRLFQPFSQVDSSISRQFGGTGLGLVISKRLVELMGGNISVSNKDTGGAEFRFELPLKRVTEQEASTITHPANESFGIDRSFASKYPVKIMVVEDNEINRRIIGLFLAEMGYSPKIVSSGAECLEALDQEPFDLIMMDIQMPGMDGLQTAHHIHGKEFPGQSPPRIVALTANARPEDKTRCQEAGFAGYVTKPLRAQNLQSVIAELFPVRVTGGEMIINTDSNFWHELESMQKNGQTGLIAETIDLFVAHVQDQSIKLREAIDKRDFPAISHHAHAMRGGATNFGAMQFARACEKLEYTHQDIPGNEIEKLLNDLAHSGDLMIQALQEAKKQY